MRNLVRSSVVIVAALCSGFIATDGHAQPRARRSTPASLPASGPSAPVTVVAPVTGAAPAETAESELAPWEAAVLARTRELQEARDARDASAPPASVAEDPALDVTPAPGVDGEAYAQTGTLPLAERLLIGTWIADARALANAGMETALGDVNTFVRLIFRVGGEVEMLERFGGAWTITRGTWSVLGMDGSEIRVQMVITGDEPLVERFYFESSEAFVLGGGPSGGLRFRRE